MSDSANKNIAAEHKNRGDFDALFEKHLSRCEKMPEGFEYEDEYEDSDGNEGCDSGTLIASLTARAKEMQRALLDKVVGQYHAVSEVV